MKDGSNFASKEYIELKDLGEPWIKRIKELQKPKNLKKAMSVSAGLQHIAALAIAPRARIISAHP